jgi:chitinase
MVYDVYGTNDYRGVGPNAPLNDTCTKDRYGSAVSAVDAWTKAHFPAYQIALGVASYGKMYTKVQPSSATAFNSTNGGPSWSEATSCDAFNKRVQANFTWDGTDGHDACGNPLPNGGIWNFNSLVSGGYLGRDGKAASGVEYRFDACSRTPYLYSPATQVMITYDDAASFGELSTSASLLDALLTLVLAEKGHFIRDKGLLGFAMWEAGADSDEILVTTVSDAMRCPS